MSVPIYFLPNLKTATAESVAMRRGILKERGLLEVFADVPQEQQPMFDVSGRGPGGLSGALLCYQTPAGGIPTNWGYYPNLQSWTPVGDGSLLWIGVDTADPARPEELARRKQYPGFWIELGDGNQWRVPIIRRPDGSTELPRDMIWDATGRLSEPIKPAYEAFWQDTAEVAAWIFDGTPPDWNRALELACRALSINYRFGRNEQNVLRIIDSENIAALLAATVGGPDDEKKRLATSAEPGLPAESETTAQAG